MEWDLARHVKNKKKGFCKYTGQKRKAMVNEKEEW